MGHVGHFAEAGEINLKLWVNIDACIIAYSCHAGR